MPRQEAMQYIAGWTVAHDVSARDLTLTLTLPLPLPLTLTLTR